MFFSLDGSRLALSLGTSGERDRDRSLERDRKAFFVLSLERSRDPLLDDRLAIDVERLELRLRGDGDRLRITFPVRRSFEEDFRLLDRESDLERRRFPGDRVLLLFLQQKTITLKKIS